MRKPHKHGNVIILLVAVALLTGCGKSGGGQSADNEEIRLEDIAVPAGFNFLTTKTVDVTIRSTDHGILENAFLKIALDNQYENMLFLGPLKDNNDFNMRFTVPGKATRLYYKVYKSDTEPFEGEVAL